MRLKLMLLPLSVILSRISATPQKGENCTPILDLGFILDTSGSIEEIYNEHVRWTVALVETLPISREAVRVSTIQYAGYPLTEFSLDTYKSKSDVVKHLQEMSFQSGVTRTGFALRRAEDEIFNVNRGARKNAAKIIALFTDGLSIDDPIKVSDHLRHKKGVKIYVISVSAEGFVPEMQRIAGENANVYGPNDLASLKRQLLNDIESSRICESNITGSSNYSLEAKSASTSSLADELKRELGGVASTSRVSTQATVIADNENVSNSKQVQDLTNSKPNNQHRKRKIRVLRRKVKHVPRESRKEARVKTRRVIQKKLRNVIARPTSSSFLAPARVLSLENTRTVARTRIPSSTGLYSYQSVVTTGVPNTAYLIQSSAKTNQKSLEFMSTVWASNLLNTVTPASTTSYWRSFVTPLAFSARKFQGNAIPLPKCPLDILLIVDSSGSVGKIYEKQKEFLSKILFSIELEKRNHRVALIQFAGAKLQKTEWAFDSYYENSQLMRAFQRVRHFTGTTYIGAALDLASRLLQRRRSDVLTLVILISDGFSQDNAIPPSEVIRSMENVELYVVSLSQYSNRDYLRQIVKDEEKVLMHEDATFFCNHLKSRLNCEN